MKKILLILIIITLTGINLYAETEFVSYRYSEIPKEQEQYFKENFPNLIINSKQYIKEVEIGTVKIDQGYLSEYYDTTNNIFDAYFNAYGGDRTKSQEYFLYYYFKKNTTVPDTFPLFTKKQYSIKKIHKINVKDKNYKIIIHKSPFDSKNKREFYITDSNYKLLKKIAIKPSVDKKGQIHKFTYSIHNKEMNNPVLEMKWYEYFFKKNKNNSKKIYYYFTKKLYFWPILKVEVKKIIDEYSSNSYLPLELPEHTPKVPNTLGANNKLKKIHCDNARKYFAWDKKTNNCYYGYLNFNNDNKPEFFRYYLGGNGAGRSSVSIYDFKNNKYKLIFNSPAADWAGIEFVDIDGDNEYEITVNKRISYKEANIPQIYNYVNNSFQNQTIKFREYYRNVYNNLKNKVDELIGTRSVLFYVCLKFYFEELTFKDILKFSKQKYVRLKLFKSCLVHHLLKQYPEITKKLFSDDIYERIEKIK